MQLQPAICDDNFVFLCLHIHMYRFGEIQSVRTLRDKFCCFINFKTSQQAGNAMSGLQVSESVHGLMYPEICVMTI